jgi:hypothetical protein
MRRNFAFSILPPAKFCGIRFSSTSDLYLNFAEESGHARFERFLSSQSNSLCDVFVFSGPGSRSRSALVQPAGESATGLRPKVWLALLGVP